VRGSLELVGLVAAEHHNQAAECDLRATISKQLPTFGASTAIACGNSARQQIRRLFFIPRPRTGVSIALNFRVVDTILLVT
jgi:hypothetical protein